MIRTIAHTLADLCFAADAFIQNVVKPMWEEFPAALALLFLMAVLFFWWVGTPA